jgi:hypothetical protein
LTLAFPVRQFGKAASRDFSASFADSAALKSQKSFPSERHHFPF